MLCEHGVELIEFRFSIPKAVQTERVESRRTTDDVVLVERAVWASSR